MATSTDKEYRVCAFLRQGQDPKQWRLAFQHTCWRLPDAHSYCDEIESANPEMLWHFHIHVYDAAEWHLVSLCGKEIA